MIYVSNYLSNLLAKKQKGMTRVEIIDELGLSDNGKIGEMLENLVSCDFLRSIVTVANRMVSYIS